MWRNIAAKLLSSPLHLLQRRQPGESPTCFDKESSSPPGSGAMHEHRTPLRTSLGPTFRMAVLAGARESVLLHLRNHSDVNAADERGRSPLILAASKGRMGSGNATAAPKAPCSAIRNIRSRICGTP